MGSRHLQVLENRINAVAIAFPAREERRSELIRVGTCVCENWEQAYELGARFGVIATDTGRHVSDAEVAIRAGFDLLIEKPLAPSAENLSELKRLADQFGRSIFVACSLRFDEGLLTFRKHLASIGEVHSVRIECQSYLPDWRPIRDYRDSYSADVTQGGVLRDLIHEIDYAVWLFGRPQRVLGVLANSGTLGIAAEDAADLLWETPSGTSVSIRLDYVSRISRRRITAFGTLGEIRLDFLSKSVCLRIAGTDPVVFQHNQERDEMIARQLTAFLNDSRPSDLTTFDEAAFALALCDAARQSSTSARWETIKDWRTA